MIGVLRGWAYRGGRHPDDVFDRIKLDFLRYIWRLPRTVRRRVRQLIADHTGIA